MAESSQATWKRQKPEQNAETTDRISSLPDSVLCHILSFLPTRTSVATGILSRRWRHLWEHLQVLDFSDDSHHFVATNPSAEEETRTFMRFAVFAYGVLALRRSRDIRRFRLSCSHSLSDSFHADSVATWVRAAIGPHLEDLRLSLYSTDGWGFVVPQSLFACAKLVSLSLCGGIHVEQPSTTVRLPSLKTLQLDIDFVDSIDMLLSGCPVLETLDLAFGPTQTTKIRVPSLKRLTFAVENDVGTDLEIDAPGLEYLSLTQKTRCSPCSVGSLHNVVEAYLDFSAVGDGALKSLKALCRTKFLVLRGSTTKCLLRAPSLDFPEFHCLLRLELTLPCFNSSFLVNMLQKCHMLQILIIQNEKEPSLLRNWIQPTSVPNCLVSHLAFIKFRGYQGFSDELAFTGYVLRRGLVLKTMMIYTDILLSLEKKHHILKELSVVPRGSNMCQLNFDCAVFP